MSRAGELGRRAGSAHKKAIRASEQEGFIGKWRDDGSVTAYGDDDHNDRLPIGQVYLTRHSEQLKGVETIAAYCLTITPQPRAGVWYRETSKRTTEILRLSGKTASDLLGARVFDFATPPKSGVGGTNLTAARDFMPGRLQVVEAGTFKLNVSEGFWYFDTDGGLKWWEPTVDNAVDVAGNVPAQDDGIDQRQITVVTFNRDATTPGLVAHDVATSVVTMPTLTPSDIVGNFTLPANHVLIGALHQRTGDTTVTREDKFISMQVWFGGEAPVASSDELVKVSVTDTTPDYLFPKLEAGANVTLTKNNEGGNETIEIAAGGTITQTAIRDHIGTATYKTTMARQERVTLNAGGTLTLADVAGLSGMVTTIWLAVEGAGVYRDAILNVYVDGELTPSVSFDIGILGLHFGSTGAYFTEHVSVEQDTSGYYAAVTFRFPIPFGTSCQIDLHNPTATNALVFSQVYYTNDITDSRRLKSAGRAYLNRVTLSAGGSLTFVDYQDGPGSLVWHSLVGDGATSLDYLEGDIAVSIDGEVSPSLISTGTEDWFLGAWYYGGGLRSTPWMLVSVRNTSTYVTMQSVDMLKLIGGIAFDEGITVNWDCSESTTSAEIAYLALYYVGQPSNSDTLVGGSGSASNVPYWTDSNTLGDSGVAYTDLRDATKIHGRIVASIAPTHGQAIVWNADDNQYEPVGVASAGGYAEPLAFNGELLFLNGDILMLGAT